MVALRIATRMGGTSTRPMKVFIETPTQFGDRENGGTNYRN